MSHVDGLANDFDIWPGICGKDGQSVPVGSGSPTLRIAQITIGGRLPSPAPGFDSLPTHAVLLSCCAPHT